MILVGTSGWQYDSWRRRFYPDGLPASEWLPYFSARLPTVEINNSFYRLPSERSFEQWRDSSAPHFCFAVKASRYITHVKRLKDPAEPVALFWSRAERLGAKLGPVLFQLPPSMPADLDCLSAFVTVLPGQMRAAIEFRHPSWDGADVEAILRGAGAALVLADRPGLQTRHVFTAEWSYIRFHQGTAAAPGYPHRKLERWADRIAAMPVRDLYVYFNNDTGGAAVRDAETLSRDAAPAQSLADQPRATTACSISSLASWISLRISVVMSSPMARTSSSVDRSRDALAPTLLRSICRPDMPTSLLSDYRDHFGPIHEETGPEVQEDEQSDRRGERAEHSRRVGDRASRVPRADHLQRGPPRAGARGAGKQRPPSGPAPLAQQAVRDEEQCRAGDPRDDRAAGVHTDPHEHAVCAQAAGQPPDRRRRECNDAEHDERAELPDLRLPSAGRLEAEDLR
jgi:uncharacterized protein YecE (DUF72 family)